MRECCGTCKWHRYDGYEDDFYCVNGYSEYYTDFTGYEDSCDEWEERDE